MSTNYCNKLRRPKKEFPIRRHQLVVETAHKTDKAFKQGMTQTILLLNCWLINLFPCPLSNQIIATQSVYGEM